MSIVNRLIPPSIKNKLKHQLGAPDMFWSIKNLKYNGFNPSKIIDIGAYQGSWTEEVLTIFPESKFLMIEAMNSKENYLKKVVDKFPEKVSYEIGLLAAKKDIQVQFHQLETASSVLCEHTPTNAEVVEKCTTTLDELSIERGFVGSEFLKLDTQGYEIEILRGGQNTLENAEVVLTEVSLIDIHQQCPLLKDMLVFMDDHNFQSYDICSFTRRPLDKALWQTDVIFVKRGSDLIRNKRWG